MRLTSDQIYKVFEAVLGKSLQSRNGRLRVPFRCNFHKDHDPAAATAFLTGNGGFHCNGCGTKGGLIEFVMRSSDCDRETARRTIAEITGASLNGSGRHLVATYFYLNYDRLPAIKKDRLESANHKEDKAKGGKGDKKFSLSHLDENGKWQTGLGDTERLLYNTPDIVSSNFDFISEGEGKCDLLAELAPKLWPEKTDVHIACTCNLFGAWKPGEPPKWQEKYNVQFTGKAVVIFADNDLSGRTWAEYIAASVYPYAKSVHMVSFPGQREKYDIADWIKERSADPDQLLRDLRQLIKSAAPYKPAQQKAARGDYQPNGAAPADHAPEQQAATDSNAAEDEWPEPEPLQNTLPDVAQFDLELLPESFRPFAKDVSERMQVPLDFPAAAAVEMLAVCTNRRAMIQPKRNDDTWIVVPNVWGACIGPSGVLKTPTIACCTQPVNDIEDAWKEDFKRKKKAYEDALEVYKIRLRVWEKECEKAIKANPNSDPPMRPDPPTPPVQRQLITSDANFESFHQAISENLEGMTLIRDELTGWLAGLERQGREQDKTFFLEGWNGNGPFKIIRIGRGVVYVPHLCIGVFGGMTPYCLRQWQADTLQDNPTDGFMQRFQLIVWPDIPPRLRNIDRKPDQTALERVAKIYRELAEMNAAKPLTLQFDEEGQAVFDEWLTDLEMRIRDDDLHPSMQAHLAKYRSLMPSLALLLALADNHRQCVPAAYVRMACDWCDYLETHAHRVYADQVRPEYESAIALSKRLLKGWKREEGTFTKRELSRKQWRLLNDDRRLRGALEVLTEYGWIREKPPETEKGPGAPSETYLINPKIWRQHGE